MRLLVVWVINAVALFVLPYIIPSIHIKSFGSAMLAALVLGLVNTLIRPILVILTLPVTLLTLGLFIFVINALQFLFVGNLLSGFTVGGFWAALLGSILYSVISWLLASLLLPLGFAIREAASGREALEIVQRERPDAVLLDINMDDLNGWQTAQLMRG